MGESVVTGASGVMGAVGVCVLARVVRWDGHTSIDVVIRRYRCSRSSLFCLATLGQ